MIIKCSNDEYINTTSSNLRSIILYYSPFQDIVLPCKAIEWYDNNYDVILNHHINDKYIITNSSFVIKAQTKFQTGLACSIQLLYDDVMLRMNDWLLNKQYVKLHYNAAEHISTIQFVQAFLYNYYFLINTNNSIQFSNTFQQIEWNKHLYNLGTEHPLNYNITKFDSLKRIIVSELININFILNSQYKISDIEALFSLTSQMDITKLPSIK